MSARYYFRHLLYSTAFWVMVISLLFFSDNKSYLLHFICFALISAFLFPPAVDLISRTFPALLKPTHWGRWVGFMALIFAIPLGLSWLLLRRFKAR